jgi:hypothetical protein
MSPIIKNKTLPVIFVGLLLALILVSACTDTSEPPVSPAPGQTPGVQEIPVTTGPSGTSGALVTTEIPGNPSCPSVQTLCDGSCIETQSNRQHCGACGNVCNESEPCSEGKCLSWTGSWKSVKDEGRSLELTQTGTSVSGTDNYNQVIITGSTSGNPPRLTGTWIQGKITSPFTYDMASDGKSFSGALLGCQILTFIR